MDNKLSFFKRASDAETRERTNDRRDEGREERGGFERRDRGDKPRFSRDDRGDKPRFSRDDRGGDKPRFSRDRRDDKPRFSRDRRDDKPRFSRDDRGERGDRGERQRPERGVRGSSVVRHTREEGEERRGRFQREEREAAPRKDFAGGRKPLAIPENLIFGVHPVREALEAGQQLEKIYTVKRGNDSIQAIVEMAEAQGVVIQYVPTPKLDYLSKQNNHQGVVATLAQIEYADLNEVLEKEPKLLLVLDGVTDVRNFGAIARSAECSGVEAIIVSAKNSAPINGEAMKSAAGALSRIPVCKVGSLRNSLKMVQEAGIQLVAATEKTETSIFDVDLTVPSAIIMGSEQKGISSDTLKLCDAKGAIPLLGTIESLNVSAAAAVILFEVVRQRR